MHRCPFLSTIVWNAISLLAVTITALLFGTISNSRSDAPNPRVDPRILSFKLSLSLLWRHPIVPGIYVHKWSKGYVFVYLPTAVFNSRASSHSTGKTNLIPSILRRNISVTSMNRSSSLREKPENTKLQNVRHLD